MKLRDKLQQGIYVVINPLVKALIWLGLTPNAVTTIGFGLNIGVATLFIVGAEKTNQGDLSYVGWGGALILFAGVFDMLDGQVARIGKMSSKFGAFYDSVLDRYSEMFMFLGICYYLVSHHYFLSSLFAFIALIGSVMVSYTRARAEGLGIECKGGLMQRPERVVIIGVSALVCGILSHYIGGDFKVYIPGLPIQIFETMTVFTLPITVMAVLTNITAVSRIKMTKRGMELEEQQRSSPVSSAKMKVFVGFLILSSLANPIIAFAQLHDNPSPLTFPTPNPVKHQLFYLQRDPNTNTIICQLNIDAAGQVNKKEPVNVYWIRYGDKGEKEELNYIQRKFAYGIKSKDLGNGQFELNFVSYKKLPMILKKSSGDKYGVFVKVNNKTIQIDRLFLRIDGGSFWSPNVLYIQVEGMDMETLKPTLERMKI
jgi:phosphatidylglycerophosphate synthase